MRILGIDPSLRSTGYGVIEVSGSRYSLLGFGEIKTASAATSSEALLKIHETLLQVIEQYRPETVAIEGVIYLQNYQTAITLGAARGAALLAVAKSGLPVFEYAPRRVKAAATGRGGAQKNQVSFMMRALLGLTENPPADAADALAIAVTHAQNQKGLVAARRL